MNSSTSNSKSRRGGFGSALKIGFVLLLFFGVAEVGARKYARRRESDVSDATDFTSISARAARLMRHKGQKIVFVGNSATQEGLDLSLLERTMNARKARAPLQATMCTAVDSGIKDWYWMLDKNYWAPGRRPDLFVVTWFSANLQDTPVIEVGRLAQFFTTPRDWRAVAQTDVISLGQRSEFVFSYFSILYAMRDVTQEKLLRLSAPGYEKFALGINDSLRIQSEAREKSTKNEGKISDETPDVNDLASYQALKRLLARAQKTNSKLCFIAYPRKSAQYAYQTSPHVIRMIREAGMTYIDLRQISGLSPDKYRDSVHVNAQGRPIWTREVARAIAPLIP